MTYNATYTADDTSSIAIDFVGKFGAALIAFVSLIVLVVLFVWIKKHMK
jgi:hypothetical protein